MANKDTLIKKLLTKPTPRNFTTNDLNALMNKIGCKNFNGGRGSSIGFMHLETGRCLQFDGPHPGKDLYLYQVKMVIEFLRNIGEI